MSRKKRADESAEAEVEYEHGHVDFETPVARKPEIPKRHTPTWVRPTDTMLEHDCGCWCGASRSIRKRCDGHPTAVRLLPGGIPNFVCPAGNGITSPPKAIIQAAEKAGLLAKKE